MTTHRSTRNPSGAVHAASAFVNARMDSPSQIAHFLGALGPGVLGALPPLLFETLVLRPMTRFTPAERAWILGGIGSLAATVIATRYPHIGVGVGIGSLAAAAPSAAEVVRVRMAIRAGKQATASQTSTPTRVDPATPTPR